MKFSEQFWGGLLVGALLSGVLVLAFSYQRLQVHEAFEDELLKSFTVAIEDVERLQRECGQKCEKVSLQYTKTLEREYWKKGSD